MLGSGYVFALWHVVITSKSVSEAEVVELAPLVALAYPGSILGLFLGSAAFALLRWGCEAEPPFVVRERPRLTIIL